MQHLSLHFGLFARIASIPVFLRHGFVKCGVLRFHSSVNLDHARLLLHLLKLLSQLRIFHLHQSMSKNFR